MSDFRHDLLVKGFRMRPLGALHDDLSGTFAGVTTFVGPLFAGPSHLGRASRPSRLRRSKLLCDDLHKDVYAGLMETMKALAGDSDAVLSYKEFTEGLFFVPFMLRLPIAQSREKTTQRDFEDSHAEPSVQQPATRWRSPARASFQRQPHKYFQCLCPARQFISTCSS